MVNTEVNILFRNIFIIPQWDKGGFKGFIPYIYYKIFLNTDLIMIRVKGRIIFK
jgi:hypothetical protein